MRLEISQKQKQTISPVVMQTLELLTIPTMELVEKLEQEAQSNPVVELEYETKPNAEGLVSEFQEKEIMKELNDQDAGDFRQLDKDINDVDINEPDYQEPMKREKLHSDYNNKLYIENMFDETNSLYTHLIEQIHFLVMTPRELEIADVIITSLDERGFLMGSTEEITRSCGYSMEEFESVRAQIMKLEPIGIASVSFEEYLMTQIFEKFGKDSIEYEIIGKYTEYIEKKYYSKLAKKMGVAYEAIEKAMENIASLNISPANNFTSQTIKYIIPDAKVAVSDDNIEVVLHDEYIPSVKLNKYYMELTKSSKDKNLKGFLRENIERAKTLIENLKSRKEIIFKVIMVIIEKQRDYFLRGRQYLNPLKLKDIADEINVHESTVSRAIKDKYIQTDWGIISLKSFFSSQVGDDNNSSQGVREVLKKIIDAEDRNDPLSDDKIVKIMKNKGIQLSRRTVAKYRGQLNIQPAFMRRNPL